MEENADAAINQFVYERLLLRLARTIADIEQTEQIQTTQLNEMLIIVIYSKHLIPLSDYF